MLLSRHCLQSSRDHSDPSLFQHFPTAWAWKGPNNTNLHPMPPSSKYQKTVLAHVLSVKNTVLSPSWSMRSSKLYLHPLPTASLSSTHFSKVFVNPHLTTHLLLIVWGRFSLICSRFSSFEVKHGCQVLMTRTGWTSPHSHYLHPLSFSAGQRTTQYIFRIKCIFLD